MRRRPGARALEHPTWTGGFFPTIQNYSAFPAAPVILFAIGQLFGDVTPPAPPAAAYYKQPAIIEAGTTHTFQRTPKTLTIEHPVWTGGFFTHFKEQIASAPSVIAFTIGQLIGDDVQPIDTPPKYYGKLLNPPVERPNISFTVGQLLGDATPTITSAPFFYKQPVTPVEAPAPFSGVTTGRRVPKTLDIAFPVWTGGFFTVGGVTVAPADANPVVEYSIGQLFSDDTPPIEATPQYYGKLLAPPVEQPYISFRIGQWVSDALIPIDSKPWYGPVIQPQAERVVPYVVGQLLSDDTPRPEVKSYYFDVPARKAEAVIPFAIGQWLGDQLPFPLQASSPYFVTESGAPKTFRVIEYSIGQLLSDELIPIAVAPKYGPVGHVKASHVPDRIRGQWIGDAVLEVDSAPFFYKMRVLSDIPPAAANPVITPYKGQLISDAVAPIEALPQYFPTIQDFAQFPANPVIEYAVGQLLEDAVAPIFMPLRPYFITESGAPKTFRVIPFSVGQELGDKTPTFDSLAQYYKQSIITPVEAPNIPIRMGQWIGDAVLAVDSAPKFYPTIQDFAQFAANPVVEYTLGQWLADIQPDIDSKPFFYRQPIETIVVAAATPVIEITIGQWLSDIVPDIDSAPQYFKRQIITPVEAPGIKFSIGQIILGVEPIVATPRFFAQPSLLVITAASPHVLYTLTPVILPLEHGIRSYPQYYTPVPQNLVVITYEDYECIRPIEQSNISSTVTYTFFAVLKRVGASDARARLFSIDDGAEVAGSEVQTSSTSFVVVESGALTLSGNKDYKAQAGFVSGSEIRILGAWVEGNPN